MKASFQIAGEILGFNFTSWGFSSAGTEAVKNGNPESLHQTNCPSADCVLLDVSSSLRNAEQQPFHKQGSASVPDLCFLHCEEGWPHRPTGNQKPDSFKTFFFFQNAKRKGGTIVVGKRHSFSKWLSVCTEGRDSLLQKLSHCWSA